MPPPATSAVPPPHQLPAPPQYLSSVPSRLVAVLIDCYWRSNSIFCCCWLKVFFCFNFFLEVLLFVFIPETVMLKTEERDTIMCFAPKHLHHKERMSWWNTKRPKYAMLRLRYASQSDDRWQVGAGQIVSSYPQCCQIVCVYFKLRNLRSPPPLPSLS